MILTTKQALDVPPPEYTFTLDGSPSGITVEPYAAHSSHPAALREFHSEIQLQSGATVPPGAHIAPLTNYSQSLGVISRQSSFDPYSSIPKYPNSISLSPASEFDLPIPSSQARNVSYHSTYPQYLPEPANYVSLSRTTMSKRGFMSRRRNTSIRGPFAVDPFMHVPAAIFSNLPTSSSDSVGTSHRPRKNLNLEVRNGLIDVDLHLVGDPPTADSSHLKTRTTLALKLLPSEDPKLNHFPLVGRIHTQTLVRPPFHLEATALDGYLSLHIPRNFQGLLHILVTVGDLDKHISISPGLMGNAKLMNETSQSRSFLVGSINDWIVNDGRWEGDEMMARVESGKVRVQYNDEKDGDGTRKLLWKMAGI